MKKLFTALIVCFPILSVYSSSLQQVSIADLCLIIFTFYIVVDFLVKGGKTLKTVIPILVFLIYILVTFLVQIPLSTGVGIFSTSRYLLYLFVLVIGVRYFVFDYGINLIKYLTLTISAYVILQYLIFILFSKTLPWHISVLPIMDNNFIEIQYSLHYLTFYRPTGIFLEPTHFAQFCVVYLTYLVFDENQKNNYLQKGIITLAILCSGSSLGFIFLLLVYGLKVVQGVYKISIKKIIAFIVLLISISILFFNVPYFMNIINRMQSDTGQFNGSAMGYRFDSLKMLFNDQRMWAYKLIGLGRSTEEAYFTGIFYILNAHGIIGLIIYVMMCFKIWISNGDFKRNLVLIVFILSIGSEYICNFGILFYFMFIIPNEKVKKMYL